MDVKLVSVEYLETMTDAPAFSLSVGVCVYSWNEGAATLLLQCLESVMASSGYNG